MPAPPLTDPRSEQRRRAIEAQGASVGGVGGNLSLTTLLGQDAVYGAPGEVPEYDWQTALPPRGRPPGPRENRTLVESLVLSTLLGQDRLYGAPGQVATYSWQLERPVLETTRHENRTWLDSGLQDVLLGQDTLYGAPGQATQYDWQLAPPPKGAAPHRSNRTWLDQGVLDTLAGQDRIYGDAGQAPTYDLSEALPKGHRYGPRFSVGLKTHAQSHLLDTLLGQDAVYGSPGQAPGYDWPLPQAHGRARDAGRRRHDVSSSVLALLLITPPENPPDGKILLPDPRALLLARAARAIRTAISSQQDVDPDLLLGVLFGQDQVYGAPGEVPAYRWLLPTNRPGRRLQPEQVAAALGLLEVVGLPPGGAVLLDRFLRLPRPQQPVGGAGALLGVLRGQDAVYGAPGEAPTYDWQLPVRLATPRPTLRTWTHDQLLRFLVGQDRLYGAPGQAPTYDWRLPIPLPLPRPALRQWTHDQLLRFLQGQDTLYGAPGEVVPYDWPLPRTEPDRQLRAILRGLVSAYANMLNVQTGPIDTRGRVRGGASSRGTLLGGTGQQGGLFGGAGRRGGLRGGTDA